MASSEARPIRNPVHWIGDAPTSLHGNGAASFERTARDESKVTCSLCLILLRRNAKSRGGDTNE